MKNKIYKILALPILSLSLFSCNTKAEEDYSSLDNYSIVEKETKQEQKVCRTCDPFNASAFSSATVGSNWFFNGNPLLYKDDCTLTKPGLRMFAKTYGYETWLEEEEYTCAETGYKTYSKKVEGSGKITIDLEKYSGIIASYYVASELVVYEVTDKTTNKQFNIYGAKTPYFDILKVID